MKNNTVKSILQKTIISLILVILLFSFIIPQYSYADDDNGVVGSLLKEVVQLFASLGDVVMGALNKFMLGSDQFLSAMLSQDDANLENNSGSWLLEGTDASPDVVVDSEYMDEKTFLLDASMYKIPNMLYCPENIFANNIAALDVNFLDPNTYTSIIPGDDQADGMSTSAVEKKDEDNRDSKSLREIIASWYKSFRNIAIVALLSVLVYLGIRIIISSTAADKAKYKESIYNWFIALCLVFVIHIIMSLILMFTENFNRLFAQEINDGIIVQAVHSDESEAGPTTFKFRTNLIGLARFKAQADQWQDATAYTIIYLALVVYTCIFTFIYFKRFLYMAFFTMIAPLVALTYPIDKVGDGKAQAFNIWFKEYTMNAILQPVHLILYSVFVSSAIDLATNNPIYAVVAIAFLLPAEKFIKKMFGLDKAESTSDFSSFAGGALAMKGMQALSHLGGKKSGGNSGNNLSSGDDSKKIRFNKTNSNAGKLDSFNKNDNEQARISENNEKQNIENEDQNNESDNQNLNRLYEDREEWSRIANDENASELDREEARQQLDFINEDIEREKPQNINGNIEREEPPKEEISSISEKNLEQEDNIEKPEKWARLNNAKKAGKTGLKILGAETWKGAKFTGRALSRTVGAVGGATVGLAAGLTTGDMSKAISFAATGAVAGNAIGKNLSKAPGALYQGSKNIKNNVGNKLDSVVDKWNEGMYGYSEARDIRQQRQNTRSRKAFYKDKEEISKAKDLAGKIGYNGKIEDLMRAKVDYYEAGITNEDLIENSIKASYESSGTLSGNTHQEYVDMAGYINKGGYTAKDIQDQERMEAMEERVQAIVGNNPNNQRMVMTKMANILGEKALYEQRMREGKTRIEYQKRVIPSDIREHKTQERATPKVLNERKEGVNKENHSSNIRNSQTEKPKTVRRRNTDSASQNTETRGRKTKGNKTNQ